MQLICFYSLALFVPSLITHHPCASILYLCQLFRVAHASDLPLLFNLNVQIQMQKNANASILTYVCRLNVQIQMQKRNAPTRTCLRIKCSNPNAKKRYASNLCLQIKCSNAADQGVHILHRALHQAIISFSNLIKLKTLCWSKTYVVIIVSVFKVG